MDRRLPNFEHENVYQVLSAKLDSKLIFFKPLTDMIEGKRGY